MAPHAGVTVCIAGSAPQLQRPATCTCVMHGASAAPGLESSLRLPQYLRLRAAQLCLHGSGVEDFFHIPCRLTRTELRGAHTEACIQLAQ